MDQTICDTHITGQYISKYLKQAFGDHADLQSFHADLIGVDQGFISKIIRLRLNWKSKDNLPDSIVVKIPTIEKLEAVVIDRNGDGVPSFADAASQWMPVAHNVECLVYALFKEECPIKAAKCYATVPLKDGLDGLIIMEDMSQKAAIAPSFLDGLNYMQVLASITEIAHLHAWSLTTSIDWRSQLPSVLDQQDIMKSFLTPIIPGMKTVQETYPEIFGSIDLEKVSKIIEWESYFGIMTEHEKYMQDVLVHGDFHKNNIMFVKNPDGSISDRLAAIIDFQGAMKGSPVYDISRILAFSVKPEVRQHHEMELLCHYFDTVKSIAGEKFEATFELIHQSYNRHLALQSIFLVVWGPQLMKSWVNGEGDQKERDEKKFLSNAKDLFDYCVTVKAFD